MQCVAVHCVVVLCVVVQRAPSQDVVAQRGVQLQLLNVRVKKARMAGKCMDHSGTVVGANMTNCVALDHGLQLCSDIFPSYFLAQKLFF